jgi:hypothetical protein
VLAGTFVMLGGEVAKHFVPLRRWNQNAEDYRRNAGERSTATVLRTCGHGTRLILHCRKEGDKPDRPGRPHVD